MPATDLNGSINHPLINHPLTSQPLKIAIIAHSLYPIAEPYAGGLEMITQLLCDELVQRGYEVTLYAHADSETKAQLRPFMTRTVFEARLYPNEHDALGMTRDELYQYHLYQEAMREIIESTHNGDFDVVHNHSLHHVPMLMGQALGGRFWTTFHTPIFAHLRLALLTLQQGTCTQFTTVSQFQQRLYNEFVPSTVVYNGIDVASFAANINEVDDECYFWFGRICPEKGTHLAMQYCLKANKKLIIAGPKSNLDYFDKEVAPLLAQDSVAQKGCANKGGGAGLLSYVGHLTKNEVNKQLTQATAVLFTSTWEEPYGLTLAESLACGCPIIGFDVGASREIVTQKTGVIVAKNDEQAFIKAFETVQTLSRADCRTRAEAFCDVKTMVDGYMQCYSASIKQATVRQEFVKQASIEQAFIEQDTTTPVPSHPKASA